MHKKILLHICCSICASSVIEQLQNEGWQVECFFYNPNIHPAKEYKARIEDAASLLSKLNVPIYEGIYDKNQWVRRVKGLEKEKEGGRRCQHCFYLRLEETFNEAKTRKIPYFTTTLTVSPHKNSKIINSIGRLIGKDSFIAKDFKKKDGFKRAVELSKEHNLYHQHYCGCVFSSPRDAVTSKSS
ncbi:MAG: epoxyqueuosine reductase QueH [Candidatus Omnitrophica bacterium]|nr:epoxyqueuosine reductase QueH [Candidatus Omnitrophota bacterium]MBU1631406.1 epoxyqueuosine reductase QueH [Candidatus Omnitrophota bacterium]MBU1889016.1 epoxyqueuosine reductase QueH [Candidatus Omnitrophota bacterium]